MGEFLDFRPDPSEASLEIPLKHEISTFLAHHPMLPTIAHTTSIAAMNMPTAKPWANTQSHESGWRTNLGAVSRSKGSARS
jgi:hypothetical protein